MKQQYLTAARLAALIILAAQGEAPAQTPAPTDAQTVLRQVLQRNPSLLSFQARVHVRVRMLNFPFLGLHLDGTSYFKRPNNYEVVFDRVPGYASGLKHVFADIADPASWERDWNVTCAGVQNVDNTPLLELQMTKKTPSNVREEDAFVDPASYAIVRMEWKYVNGGSITMTQSYKSEGAFTVIASQHADIHIPHVRAVADADYDSLSNECRNKRRRVRAALRIAKMFTHHSHNWFLEAVALWFSFLPAFAILLLIVAAQTDGLRRSARRAYQQGQQIRAHAIVSDITRIATPNNVKFGP